MIGNDESPLPDTEVHYLRSEHVGDEFKILVGHCGPPNRDRGIVFVSDANYLFGTAVDIVRLLGMVGDLPQLLVIGIGYRVATIQETLGLRNRDFTPTVDSRETADPAMMGVQLASSGSSETSSSHGVHSGTRWTSMTRLSSGTPTVGCSPRMQSSRADLVQALRDRQSLVLVG